MFSARLKQVSEVVIHANLARVEVGGAGSGSEALEALKRRFFDIVITDLYLTPVSGMEVLRAAQTAKRDTIVIVITGHPSVTTSIEALRAGAWDTGGGERGGRAARDL